MDDGGARTFLCVEEFRSLTTWVELSPGGHYLWLLPCYSNFIQCKIMPCCLNNKGYFHMKNFHFQIKFRNKCSKIIWTQMNTTFFFFLFFFWKKSNKIRVLLYLIHDLDMQKHNLSLGELTHLIYLSCILIE